MNPPFDTGDKHLLHAWDILEDGHILCLLSEQTVINTHSAARQRLVEIAGQHGEIISLGECFSDAERKTRVRVSLVHLQKAESKTDAYDFMRSGFQMEASVNFDGGEPYSEVATRNEAKNLVLAYAKARDLFLDVALKVQELGYYAKMLGSSSDISKAVKESLGSLVATEPTKYEQESAYSEFIRQVKRSAWDSVFNLSGFKSFLSEGVRKDFDKLQDEQGAMAFNEANIAAMLEMLVASREGILKQCVCDSFDYLTKYHNENRLEAEGWKTNDGWRVNKKFILPYIVDNNTWAQDRLHLSWSRQDNLKDLDRAMASLDGKRLEDVPLTIVTALHDAFLDGAVSGSKIRSTYFEMRPYKKGTVHFRFLDAQLWEQFNLVAAQGKNWLPDDYKAREREARSRNNKADKYGLPIAI